MVAIALHVIPFAVSLGIMVCKGKQEGQGSFCLVSLHIRSSIMFVLHVVSSLSATMPSRSIDEFVKLNVSCGL